MSYVNLRFNVNSGLKRKFYLFREKNSILRVRLDYLALVCEML